MIGLKALALYHIKMYRARKLVDKVDELARNGIKDIQVFCLFVCLFGFC